MTQPLPHYPPGPPRIGRPRQPFGWAAGWLVGLSVTAALAVGALVWFLVRAFEAIYRGLAGTDDPDVLSPSSTQEVLQISAVVAAVLLVLQLALGLGTLGLLRLSDGYAGLPTFAQALLAWLAVGFAVLLLLLVPAALL